MALRAAHASFSQLPQFQVHELKSPVNTVKEYVNANGKVFAVTWQGISNPDLGQLLGSYYKEYLAGNTTLASSYHTRRPASFKTRNLVMHRFGQMRDVHGLIYLRSIVPPNVNPEDLP